MNRRIVIKVCGLTEERDAHEAIHLGVDALGFDFRPESPRYVEPELVARIVERVPAFVTTVGVFADTPLIRVLEIARQSGVSLLQFHGTESPSLCAGAAPYRWIKAFRMEPGFDPEDFSCYPCTTFLLDARADAQAVPEAPFAWRRARTWSTYGHLILAGGLEPAQVGMAIEDARPYGVDVLAEAEIAPGKKDLDRLELVVDAVRRAQRRIEGEA